MSNYVDLPDGSWRLTIIGLVYKPNIGKCIEYYVDSNFASGWYQEVSDNAENVIFTKPLDEALLIYLKR